MRLLLVLVVIICNTCTYKPVLNYKVQVISDRKEWASTVTGKKKLYLDHIYNTSK
jgi:hypothetical protein